MFLFSHAQSHKHNIFIGTLQLAWQVKTYFNEYHSSIAQNMWVIINSKQFFSHVVFNLT